MQTVERSSEASKRLSPMDLPTYLTGRSRDGQVVGKSVQEHLLLLRRLSYQPPYPSLHQFRPRVAVSQGDKGEVGKQED